MTLEDIGRHVGRVLALAVLACAAIGPSTAHAEAPLPAFMPDVSGEEGKPVPPRAPGGANGMTTLADIYTVNPLGTHAPWGTIRRYARSFAIGNAADGWRFDVTFRNAERSWYYGLVTGGGLTKCTWIAAMNLDPTSSTVANQCGSTGTKFAVTDFASYVNCTSCDGGYLVTTQAVAGCTDTNIYANVRPWQATTAAQNPVGTFTPGVTKVYWRYRTKDDRYILVGLPDRGDGNAEWAFIQRGCLPHVVGHPATSWDEGSGV